MRVLRRGTRTGDELVVCQDHPPVSAAFVSTRAAVLKASLADLWPVTIIAVALGLTVAWTGVLASLLWLGLEELI
jgi:hypothetical protein